MTQKIKPVYEEIPFESPLAVYEALRAPRSFLFESVKGPERIARWSFIGIDPYLFFTVRDGTIEIEVGGRKTLSSRRPLDRLRDLVNCYPQSSDPDLPPFQGGAAGIFNYDFVKHLERLPSEAVDDLGLPDARFMMIDRLVAFDHLKKKAWVIVCPGARQTVLGYSNVAIDSDDLYEKAASDLDVICEKIRSVKMASKGPKGDRGEIRLDYDVSRDRYIGMVRAAKEYIAAGDIFQANLSLRASADVSGYDPLDIYKVLRKINPSPFSAFADFGDYQIASSSPERLVRVRDGIVDTRPIAGTRPRGRDSGEDERMRRELLLNEKERAEHIMLIDLERNDIGRVASYGSVHVDELMVTEDYSHVIHIVSNVEGTLAEGKDCFDVVRAVFPGGTITGVPKVRCMEIIDELEPFRRGPYTGSMGYIGFNGCMDLNIIIRTFLIKDGKAYIQAGAGIVADSDPEREYNECVKKAEALLRTLAELQQPDGGCS